MAVDDTDGVAGDQQFFVRGDGVGERPGIIGTDEAFPADRLLVFRQDESDRLNRR